MGFCPPHFEPQDQNKIYYTLSQTRLAAPASAFQRRALELLSKRPFRFLKPYLDPTVPMPDRNGYNP